MSSFLIAETPLSQIRPVDAGLRPGLFELTQVLRRHLDQDEADKIASAFADPVAGEGRATIDWYSDLPKDPVAVTALSEEDATSLLEEVGALRARLLEVAQSLTDAQSHPQDARLLEAIVNVPNNQDYIYSAGGKPVLVAWGYKAAAPGAVPVPAGKWVDRKSAGAAAGAVGAGAGVAGAGTDLSRETVVASGPVILRAPLSWIAWLLWFLFLLLILAIAYVLLTACSVGYPQLSLSQRGLTLLNRCPVPVVVASDVEVEQAREASLRRDIEEAELALAREGQTCRVERIREAQNRPPLLPPELPVEEPVEDVVPEPEPDPIEEAEAPANDDVEDALERVRQAGGGEGELQVILEWDGPADLDIYVDCDGQSIAFSQRENCSGGTLDVDANHEIQMDEPVENVRWEQRPPPGTYGIRVRNAKSQGDPRPQIPFRVHVRQGDEVQTYEGSVGNRQSVDVTELVVE